MSTHMQTDRDRFLQYLDGACRRSPHTIRAYRTGLEQYADFLRRRKPRRTYRTADMDDVIAYAQSMRDAKPTTAALRMAAVRRLHGYLHARGEVDRDVARMVPSPRRDRGHRPAPSTHRVAAARQTIVSARDKSLFGLMYGSGLRISEVRYALKANVDLHAATITVLGKGRAWRTVELDAATHAALADWTRISAHRRNPYLFGSHHGGSTDPISETPIRYLLKRAATASGLDPAELKPHALRRSIGRAMRQAGADPFTIQAVYGHASLDQTADYVRGEGASLPHDIRRRLVQLQTPPVSETEQQITLHPIRRC